MSRPRPYDDARREGGSSVFIAELPAFAAIGRRFDELYDAYFDFEYPSEHLAEEREFIAGLEEAAARAGRRGSDWKAIEPELEARFGAKYRDLKGSYDAMLRRAVDLSPQTLSQFLGVMAGKAKAILAHKAPETIKSEVPPESNPYAELLGSEEFRKGMDGLKAVNPAAQAGIERALAGLSGLLGGDPGPKMPPMTPAVAKILEMQKQALERMKVTNPDVARRMEQELAEMEGFAAGPAGFPSRADVPTEDLGGDDDEPEEEQLPAGTFRFACAGKAPNPNQKRLFDWLAENQAEVASKVEQALRTMHAEQAEGEDAPRELVIFPTDASSDVPLSFFRVERFYLAEDGRRIGITFDTVREDEHGCALVIEDAEVIDAGYYDVLEALYAEGEEIDPEDDE
jgi:hypothetical protein